MCGSELVIITVAIIYGVLTVSSSPMCKTIGGSFVILCAGTNVTPDLEARRLNNEVQENQI